MIRKIIERLQSNNAVKLISTLLLLSVFSITIEIARIVITRSLAYCFLIWNLFLAWIPFMVSMLVNRKTQKPLPLAGFIIIAGVWLLFFPNTLYIITDLFHIRRIQSAPIWLDLIIILSFAVNGLFLGFSSLVVMQKYLSSRFPKIIEWLFVSGSLLLGSFGIYLGRYLRWNSWDIIANPQGLFADIIDRIAYPTAHPRTYAVTILFFIFFCILYVLFKTTSQWVFQDNGRAAGAPKELHDVYFDVK